MHALVTKLRNISFQSAYGWKLQQFFSKEERKKEQKGKKERRNDCNIVSSSNYIVIYLHVAGNVQDFEMDSCVQYGLIPTVSSKDAVCGMYKAMKKYSQDLYKR